ncbi:calcium-binding protein [Salmonella enterica]|uniref:beta strand repeat-containing protein n=1 Tax=Salmonella enterica TaxID=28901 RepID=UPI00127421CB|nr:calcium-binding protein [Salmonella enterica]EAS0615377.1 calcium-binding protein [Salmonella enterica subsp. enterica serovar Dahomey]EBQ9004935.1 calcium-binding protein [Salmonella enterica subsp. enterica serovar Blockley]EBS0793150.1 calcium-binding protein [Salmonella enterica subsp. enterica serovar Overschie]EBZ5137399.1 calcium-binding protein [Salmonella enterica subsp. enterica serovar Antsalova]ECD5540903.1 calcium-binding protein [Salmonella enterica subsp. enterica serovar Kok
MKQDNSIIIKTFQDNNLNIPFKGTSIAIDGQDIVLSTSAGKIIRLPFAAQLISIASGSNTPVFEITFSDGVTLTADKVLSLAISSMKENDGVLAETKNINAENDVAKNSNDSSDNEQFEQPQVLKEPIVVREVVEKIVEIKEVGSTIENQVYDIVNQKFDFEDAGVYKINTTEIKSSTSASTKKEHDFEFQKEESEPTLGILNYPSSVKLLQLDTQYDFDDGIITAGGGSRDIFDFQHQYGRQVIDMSSRTTGMTFDAVIRGSHNYSQELTKIINLGDGYRITSISNENNGLFRLVTSNSDEGQALGLSPNEFAIIYNTNINYEFTIPVSAENTGVTYDYKLGFRVSDTENLDSIIDSSGFIILDRKPSPLIIKGTSGDDVFKAGYGNDIYDGGNGNDTLTYQGHDSAVNIDFSASQKLYNILSNNGIASENPAIVTTGDTEQYISNFNTIIGSDYGDRFILYDNNIKISAGNGDDSFIIHGGGFDIDGGAGVNNIDFSQLSGTSMFKNVQYGNKLIHKINGVEVNLKDGTVHFNNGTDQIGRVDNISHIRGTQGNDLITGSDADDVIDGFGGSDIIYASAGNDIIAGGGEGSVLDYSGLQNRVDIDFNLKEADKGNYGKDSFSNINTIVSSSGGGNISSDGVSGTFIGTAGDTSFLLKNGYFNLYSGKGSNEYTVDKSIINIAGNGSDKITVNESIFNYTGASSISSDITISAGQAEVTTGNGNTTITGKNSAIISLYTSGGGTLLYKSQGASVDLYLDEKTNTTLDYSLVQGGITTKISSGTIKNALQTDIIHSGNVNEIIGSDSGNNNIDASALNYSVSLVASGKNNKFISGNGLNNHFQMKVVDKTNILDYSQTNTIIHVDLSTDSVSRTNANGVVLGNDNVLNFNYIKGSTGTGNTYRSKDGVDTIFDIQYGVAQTIYAKQSVSDTYIVRQGNTDTLDYSELTDAIRYTQFNGGNNSTVLKSGNDKDTITNVVHNLIGTNHGDYYLIGNLLGSQNILAGNGNDTIELRTNGGNNDYLNFEGGAGINTFIYAGSTTTNFLIYGSETISIADRINIKSFKNIEHKGWASAEFRWFEGADNINLKIAQHNNGSHFTFKITEGAGNTIDGGTGFSESAWSRVDYSQFKTGIIADLSKSKDTVTTSSGHSDSLKNINSILGTDYNDTITGAAHKTYFLASKGNDSYTGKSNQDVYTSSYTNEVNVDSTGSVSITKSGQGTGGTDTLSGIKTINLSDNNDVIKFSTNNFADFNINAGGGNDTLKEGSLISDLNLGNLSTIQGVETIDISTGNHNTIKFNLDGYFSSHSSQNILNLKVSSVDAANKNKFDFHVDNNNKWTEVSSNNGIHTYIDTHMHQLVVHVV